MKELSYAEFVEQFPDGHLAGWEGVSFYHYPEKSMIEIFLFCLWRTTDMKYENLSVVYGNKDELIYILSCINQEVMDYCKSNNEKIFNILTGNDESE